jgi:hypothetical protein
LFGEEKSFRDRSHPRRSLERIASKMTSGMCSKEHPDSSARELATSLPAQVAGNVHGWVTGLWEFGSLPLDFKDVGRGIYGPRWIANAIEIEEEDGGLVYC